jgi:transcription initiation factor TFIIIB Brf1 subunit/transcription initiation factor TFIIB
MNTTTTQLPSSALSDKSAADCASYMRNVSKSAEKTKKRKNALSSSEKEKMWAAFQSETSIDDKAQTANCVYQSNSTVTNECISCGSALMVMDDGFPTCLNKSCGMVYTDTLDYSPEWRYFGADDKNANDPTRCGNPINPLLEMSSYGCKVLHTPKSSKEMIKIGKWIAWQSMPHKEKSLYDEFQFITIMAQNAGINKIFINHAMAIHKDISEQKIFRGINRDGIKAASIYISCRLNGCPRTSHEIAEIFNIDKASATAGCSTAVNILNNIERGVSIESQTDLCLTKPSDFVDRYCSKLGIPEELVMVARFVTEKVENGAVKCNNTPHSIAAGIIYFVAQNCNQPVSKTDVRRVCGVSEVTINKCFMKMQENVDQLIPKMIRMKYSANVPK